MKKHLRKISIIRWLDDWTDTGYGRVVVALAVIIAIAMFWYWRTLK